MDGAFEELLAELEQMSKAHAAPTDDGQDDKRIRAAAHDGGAATQDTGQDGGDPDQDDEGEEHEVFGKSFPITLEDGSRVHAYDATQAMARMHESLTQVREQVETLRSHDDALRKGIELTGGLLKSLTQAVQAQSDLLKALQNDVTRLASQGTGRKAAVSVHDKPSTTAPPRPDGIPRGELLAKAQSAVVAGKITSLEAARVESYVNRGLQPPADILSRIEAA